MGNSPNEDSSRPIYLRFYQMLDPLPMLKRQYKSVKTLSGLQTPKIKCNCRNNASLHVDSFTSTILL